MGANRLSAVSIEASFEHSETGAHIAHAVMERLTSDIVAHREALKRFASGCDGGNYR